MDIYHDFKSRISEYFTVEKLKSLLTVEQCKKILFHTATALTITSGLSYVTGFFRDRLLAHTFGASAVLDVYYASFVIPDFILAFIVTSAVGVAFVPLFTRSWTESNEEARSYAYSMLVFLMLVVVALAACAALFAPYLADKLVPGFDEANKELYVSMMRIMLLSPLIFTISNIFGGVLLSTKDFFFYGIAPVFYNLGIILGVVFFVPTFGAFGLAYGTICGALLHMISRSNIAIARIGFVRGVKLWGNPKIRETVVLVLPKILHIASWQFLLLWFVRIATEIQEGGVTIYSFARNFQSMPVSLIGIAIALSTFTVLSRQASDALYTNFRQTIIRKALMSFVFSAIAAWIMYVVSYFLVSLLLGGGEFGEEAIAQTTLLLKVYALSIPLESLIHLFARAHYALKRTFIPSLISIGVIGGIVLSTHLFASTVGLTIIPLAFFGGLLVQNILLILSLRYYMTRYDHLRNP